MPLPKALLRMKDLKCVGIRNWPTLKRRIQQDNFPPGRYVGKNTRVWTEEEVELWWATRPSAAPPEILKPAPLFAPGEAGRETEVSLHHPQNSDSADSAQALPKKGDA